MKTIDEQIECAKALLTSLEEEKAAQEANAVKAAEPLLTEAWAPEIGHNYYSIDSEGRISKNPWYADVIDARRYKFGNVYKTYEEAEFERERRKVETELRRYIYEHGGGDGEFVRERERNYYMYYGSYKNRIIVDCDYEKGDPYYYVMPSIYSASREVLCDAINAIGEDRIKKYYLRVKE